MNQVKLNELIKSKTITIPLYVLKMYKEFNLSSDEMILLLFLYDKDGLVFDPDYISNDLNLDIVKVMEGISKLVKKSLLSIKTKTNELGVKEEVIDLTPLFNKITIKLMEEFNKENDKDINVYSILEEEFNRKLTPMECEMVDDWKKNEYSNEIIKEAVREATLNGVSSLRYIDKILIEWNKKGYKSKDDIKKKNKKEETKEKIEIYNCDWLDSDEEL